MIGNRLHARSSLAIRREAVIQFGLGVLALLAAALGTWWLLQSRLHPSDWLGVAGALTLALTFLSEGHRAREEYNSQCGSNGPIAEMKLANLGTAHQAPLATHSGQLLAFMVFGIVASIGGPGLSILLRIVSRRGVSTMDLLVWVLFTLPIALAVWMLPPRGLGRTSGARAG